MSSCVFAAALVLVAACGGGGGDDVAVPTAGPAAPDAAPEVATTAVAALGRQPLLFRVSATGGGGDVIGLQGSGWGTRPQVRLHGAGGLSQELPVLSRAGEQGLAVQLPGRLPPAAALTVSRDGVASAPWRLNAPRPEHLDTTELAPGGRFHIVGRNLLRPGVVPRVSVDGRVAKVDLAASQEQVLVASAPEGLRAGTRAVVRVDDGNGPVALPQAVAVARAGRDPFGTGVGWAAAFAVLQPRAFDAATDARLPARVRCDGQSDDAPALQAALRHVSSQGGGVLRLPAGHCRLAASVQLPAATVLQGAGRGQTLLLAQADSPLWTNGADLVALRQLSMRSTLPGATSSLNFKKGSRVLVQDVAIDEGEAATAWMYGIENLAILDSAFTQVGTGRSPGAVQAVDNRGFVFARNEVRFAQGIGTSFDQVRDAWVEGNRWTRDAARQAESGVVHTVTLNFARRIALVGNSFEVVNGPVDQSRNDGEALLTEGGGAQRTEGIGSVVSASPTTLFDPSARLPAGLVAGALPDNYGIVIVAGRGAGQARRVTGFAGGRFTVDSPWDLVPDAGSRYATALWGLEKALIQGNRFTQHPRGIWLYSTAVRDVDIVGNTLVENGGILVRAFQRLDAHWFSPLLGVRVLHNDVRNDGGLFQSYIAVHFANADGLLFGASHLGVEVRDNLVRANAPNTDGSPFMGPAGREGYMNQMNVETPTAARGRHAALLGTVMQGNRCERCDTAFRLGSGAEGTVIVDSRLRDCGTLWSNTVTAPGTTGAVGTYVR